MAGREPFDRRGVRHGITGHALLRASDRGDGGWSSAIVTPRQNRLDLFPGSVISSIAAVRRGYCEGPRFAKSGH